MYVPNVLENGPQHINNFGSANSENLYRYYFAVTEKPG